MGAGPPKGNKNAVKWTLEKSTELLEKAIELANEKETITKLAGKQTIKIEAYKYDFIGEIACELDTYHTRLTRDTPDHYPELKPLVSKLIKLMERNCYANTKKEMINTAVGIINLKSNHKWTDRVQNDHTTKGEKITPPITWSKPNE